MDVVGRESRGEGRVPGMIGWWVLEVVDDDEVEVGEGDDERGRFRLRKDIWCLCMVKVCTFTLYKLVLFTEYPVLVRFIM